MCFKIEKSTNKDTQICIFIVQSINHMGGRALFYNVSLFQWLSEFIYWWLYVCVYLFVCLCVSWLMNLFVYICLFVWHALFKHLSLLFALQSNDEIIQWIVFISKCNFCLYFNWNHGYGLFCVIDSFLLFSHSLTLSFHIFHHHRDLYVCSGLQIIPVCYFSMFIRFLCVCVFIFVIRIVFIKNVNIYEKAWNQFKKKH